MNTTTITADDLAPALAAYAARMHAGVGDRHHLISPAGAWILLALCAAESKGRLRDALTASLGADVDDAAAFAAHLLGWRHPAVSAAAGIWTSPMLNAEDLAKWLARLPVPVERGELPSQTALDRWAAERTGGLIRTFPVRLDPQSVFLLATVLATKVRWRSPFRTVPASELSAGGSSEWSAQVRRVLRTPSPQSHWQFIARTDRAGDVGVHTVDANEGLAVTSVVAERGVRPPDVIATAYELAMAIAVGRALPRRSLFDLPLGDAPLWTISEHRVPMYAPGAREERCMAVLPAWSAEATHDLGREELGFPAAAAALAQLTGFADDYRYEAKQSVVARYNRTGFEAAALSSFGLFGAAAPPRAEGIARQAMLRFGHPFAVVAVVRSHVYLDEIRRVPGSNPWIGLPVYSAWVAQPVEADTHRENEEMFGFDGEPIDEAISLEQREQFKKAEAAPGPAASPVRRGPRRGRLDSTIEWIRRRLS